MKIMNSELQQEQDKSFTLPSDGSVPTLVAISDSGNSSSSSSSSEEQKHHNLLFSWPCPHHSSKEAPHAPSRSCSHAVTHARAVSPKPPLPIKAARAMNCVSASLHYNKTLQPVDSTKIHCPPAEKQRSSLKRSSTCSEKRKHVHFGELHMRCYELVLGDHPDCSSGPPVSIAWKYSSAETISVDEYEKLKSTRRSMDQLELNYFVRKRMLRRISRVSDEEMRSSMDTVYKIQRQRLHTKRLQPIYKVREAMIQVSQGVKQTLTFGRNDGRERD